MLKSRLDCCIIGLLDGDLGTRAIIASGGDAVTAGGSCAGMATLIYLICTPSFSASSDLHETEGSES